MELFIAHIEILTQGKTYGYKNSATDDKLLKQQAIQISTAKQAVYAASILTGMVIHYLVNLNYLLIIAAPLLIDGLILS